MKCPLESEMNSAIEIGQKFTKVMRRLRRKIDDCKNCPMVDDCKIRERFNTEVDSIITELNEEWGLI